MSTPALVAVAGASARPRDKAAGDPERRPGRPRALEARLQRVSAWPGGARRALPGFALAGLLAVPATLLGRLVPVLGGAVLALIAGAVAGPALRAWLPSAGWEALRPGAAVAGKRALQAAVVTLGAALPLSQAVAAGGRSLPVMLTTLAVALAGGALLGRVLRVTPRTRLLIGVGTGICGASAIAAVTAVVGAEEASVAYAMGTIFAFNIAAVVLFPLVGHALGLSQASFGLWAGTAVNDTSSVVAAAYSYGHAAGAEAVVVKLTRALMIVPICAGLGWARSRRAATAGAGGSGAARRAFPMFIAGFLAASALATLGVIPASWHGGVTTVSQFLTAVALAGIGLTLDLAKVRGAGLRPLVLGGALWVAVALTSLGMQAATGQL